MYRQKGGGGEEEEALGLSWLGFGWRKRLAQCEVRLKMVTVKPA